MVVEAAFSDSTERLQFRWALRDLANPEEDVRVAGAEKLRAIDHDLSVQALCARFVREESATVREECLSALTAIGRSSSESVDRILERGLADAALGVRLAAVRGTYRLVGREGASALARLLTDDSLDVRRRAATCLGWLGDQDRVVELQPLLDNETPSVRQAAIDALANLRAEEVLPSLVEDLCECLREDEVPEVRGAAFRFLTSVKPLADSLPENEQERRLLAARWQAWWRETPPAARGRRAKHAGSAFSPESPIEGSVNRESRTR